MSGFDNHFDELAALDREIRHYAELCGVEVADHAAIHHCLAQHHDSRVADKPRETLQSLLMLRLKVEEEMLQLGMQPPAFGGWSCAVAAATSRPRAAHRGSRINCCSWPPAPPAPTTRLP